MYRWGNVVPGFDMPLKVFLDGQETWLKFGGRGWSFLTDIEPCKLVVAKDFYVSSFNLMGDN